MKLTSRKEKSFALKKAKARLRLKLDLESPFKRELRSYFFQLSKDIKSGRELGTIAQVLDKQYKRISKKMTGLSIKRFDDSRLESLINQLLMGRSEKQALEIDKYTRKLYRRSIELARQELIDDGVMFPTQETINKVAANILLNYNRNRSGGIAITETQSLTEEIIDVKNNVADEMMREAIVENDTALAQEAARLSESYTHEEMVSQIETVDNVILFAALNAVRKTWVTMGDSKVRPAHQSAAFQVVNDKDPFIVGGAQLMYPGDSSMGAHPELVIGCRCSSISI